MSESGTESSAPSLEQILWRAMDRWSEQPALLDAEEFADHIAGVFDGDLPAERFVERFFTGNPELAALEPDLAEAVVRSRSERLHVYSFDLKRLEYVVLEDLDQVVVVSDFGQFALANDDRTRAALKRAEVPEKRSLERRGLDRATSEPRGYLVRKDGEIVGLDVTTLAAALGRLSIRQVSTPAVEQPLARLLPFKPSVRRLAPVREVRALRDNEPRLSRPLPPPARAAGDIDISSIANALPSTAAPAVFVLLPDGSLARPQMGSATRWREMVSEWTRRAALLGVGGASLPVSGSQRFAVETGTVTAIFDGVEQRFGPGGLGTTATVRSEGIVAARADFAPVRVLGDDELVQAVAAHQARLVSGWTAPAGAEGRSFWIQPEAFFAPTEGDRQLVARVDSASSLEASSGEQLAATHPQLGEITGDPWTDWAMQVSQESGAPLTAKALRSLAPRQIQLRGEPVLAFRAPDGTLVANDERGPIRLAAIDRNREGGSPDGAALGDAAPSGAIRGYRPRANRLASLSGALPATALAALRNALERSAVAGGYKLPAVKLMAAPDAFEAGRALPLAADDRRRGAASLAGAPALANDPGGKVARLMLSMPFPNAGEVHVGPDLADALNAWLAAPVVPAPAADAVARPPPGAFSEPVWSGGATRPASLHWLATSHARHAQGELAATAAFKAGAAERFSNLPPLLHRAVLASGDFRPGPGAAMPSAIRQFALSAPFEAPDLVFEPALEAAAPRPLGPGEEEIVIPLPLWVQMGRGQATLTDQVMTSPIARTSYSPPLGTYSLVRPAGFGLLDPDDAPPPGTSGVVELSGPTGIRLRPRLRGGARAESAGGKLVLGHAPLDDGESLLGARGRVRVGEPLHAPAMGERPAVRLFAEPETRARPARPAPGAPFSDAAPLELRSGVPVPGSTARPAPGAPFSDAAPLELRSGVPVPGSTAPDAVLVASAEALGVEGLPPGAWSGALPGSTGGYVPWSYSAGAPSATAVGGVKLASIPRPDFPAVPTGLRFRYAGAPLWWSGALRNRGGEEARASASRAVRSGLRAANSAAAIWRSIFVPGAPAEDLSGGMDRGYDRPARGLSEVERRMEILVALGLPGGGQAASAAAARGPETIYVAMDEQGRAGPVTAEQVRRGHALAQSVEMRIVAAIPPSPPPLQSMGGAGSPIHPPQILARQRHAPGGEHKAEEVVSQSRIEGSVDAVAQRIYHRIRQRIASDRERFGG